jgi:hypothetical protein
VLRNTDLSRLEQVRAARAAGTGGDATEQLQEAKDIQGRRVDRLPLDKLNPALWLGHHHRR